MTNISRILRLEAGFAEWAGDLYATSNRLLRIRYLGALRGCGGSRLYGLEG